MTDRSSDTICTHTNKSRGIRGDLRERLTRAHNQHSCLVPRSSTERHRLREALRRGDVLAPAPHVYALPELWEQLKPPKREVYKIRALSKLHPTWVFCGVSAAVAYGLSVSYSLLGTVHVACKRNSRTRNSPGIARHVFADMQEDATIVHGIPVTSISRTAFDCARSCAFPDGLAILDSALRIWDLSNEELIGAFCNMNKRHVGMWRAIEIAKLASPLAESGGESVARAWMYRLGIMIPDLQVEVPDPVDASRMYRVDFCWNLPTGRIMGELDGREKYRNPEMTGGRDAVEVFSDERLRESRITNAGKIVRFSYADATNPAWFYQLLTSFGIPAGFEIPKVAM